MNHRLIVVSNRVASPETKQTGGLATALRASLQENGGIWFGWSGNVVEDNCPPKLHSVEKNNIHYCTLDLNKSDYDGYYCEFSNRVLWPLFHFRPDLVEYHREAYQAYLRVNEKFADRIAKMAKPEDLIWVHDYHLIPLASMLRERGVKSRIGFFLHIPFPPEELIETLPGHLDLLKRLADYNLIGVQRDSDNKCVAEYLSTHLDAKTKAMGYELPDGKRYAVQTHPIGIDVEAIEKAAKESVTHPDVQSFYESLGDKKLIIGVDRLDYSKGLPERFNAFGHLLQSRPDYEGKTTLLQIAPPSRTEVPEYQRLREELEHTAGHINGVYATPDWMPIRYINQSYPHGTLTGFYRRARVAMVTPLRDGMNLVAKEFVASQDPDDPGVLILSQFAGAAEELVSALVVNPQDEDQVAEALHLALTMPLRERQRRWEAMYDLLCEQDIHAWREGFLKSLTQPKVIHSARVATLHRGQVAHI